MLRKRHQYRILQAAFVFALIGIAFFGAYSGMQSQLPRQEHAAQPSANTTGSHVKEAETFWQRATTDPVAALTLALVLVTACMTRAVFNQVSLARDEFNATHRPELVIREVSWEMVDMDGGEVVNDDAITFALVNRGSNSCTIIESIFGLRMLTPDGRALPTGGVNLLGRVDLAAGEFQYFRQAMDFEDDAFIVGARSLNDCYFRGTIIYKDRAGARRRYVFTRICKRGTDLFVKSPDAEEGEYTD